MSVMLFELIATLCAGFFAGAAAYVTMVEHPARLACGTVLAATEFVPSYRRASVMQATLAALGLLTSAGAWWQGRGALVLVAGLLLGVVIPFTLLVILPPIPGCSIRRSTEARRRRRACWRPGAACTRCVRGWVRCRSACWPGTSPDRAEIQGAPVRPPLASA